MLAGLAWLGGLISMISESLGELLTTMRVGPIVVGPRVDEKLDDIPEGMCNSIDWPRTKKFTDFQMWKHLIPIMMILPKKKFQQKNTKTQFTIQKLNGKNRMLPISKTNAQGRPQVRYHNYYHDHLTSIKDKVNLYSVILSQKFWHVFWRHSWY